MRVVALADSDSYTKWAAALITRMPADWQADLVVVRTAKQPSAAQLRAALAGTAVAEAAVPMLSLHDAVAFTARQRPDIVVVAAIGPLADLLAEAVLDASPNRPVIVSGLPGIALPARRKALIYRSQADMLVLHSHREVELFTAIAAYNGFQLRFGLATLPFLEEQQPGERSGDVVFAAQAIVPPTRRERLALLASFVAYAQRHPERRLVVKVRAVAGEGQTHEEFDSYAELLASRFPNAPANLVVESGSMAHWLRTASAFVTVSSTAALEAIAAGVPVLAIDDFGVTPELINDVFVGSGLLGSTADLLANGFREPEAEWLHDNYFHDHDDNTWVAVMQQLVAQNAAGELAPRARIVRGGGGAMRRAWDRKRALGRHDRSLTGLVALAIGTPARTVVLAWNELRALVRAADPGDEQPVALTNETSALDARSGIPRRTP